MCGDAEHGVALDVEGRVELRLLRQVADLRPLGDKALADEFGVEAGHDAQQRRLARAVDAEHADLGVRVEGEVDVLQDLLAARLGLGQALHVIDELARGHAKFLGIEGGKLAAGNIRGGERVARRRAGRGRKPRRSSDALEFGPGRPAHRAWRRGGRRAAADRGRPSRRAAGKSPAMPAATTTARPSFSSAIPGMNALVQCGVLFDVTRNPHTLINCYELR